MSNNLKLYSPINELKEIDDNIWIVDGDEIKMDVFVFRIPFTTRMTIIKFGTNKLWIHSPIAFSEELNDKIKMLGEVAHIIAPNKFHYSYILEWHKQYPNAKIWFAKGVDKKIQPCDTINFEFLEERVQTEWLEEILFIPFRGSVMMEEVVFFHKKSSTVIFTDLIENIEPKDPSIIFSLLLEVGDNKYPKARTPRDLRASFLDKKVALSCYQKIKNWNPSKIIFSHGKIILEDGHNALRRSFFWLENLH